MKLIVGLGNPGEKYSGNRHNIGFMAADEIARGYEFGPWKKRFQGYAAEGQIGVEKCLLLKPGTYMNESGRSAGEALRFYKLPLRDVIVIHDELDLKPGMVRVKTGGGNAGHNGLKSLSAHIGNDYLRVRLGIGHPGDKTLVTSYVLQDFAKADREWLPPLLECVARGMTRLVEGGEAAFLSEAARGRSATPQAAKQNAAPEPAPGPKGSASPPVAAALPAADAETLAIIAAAASRPIKPMPAAAREGGGGAVSSVVVLPEPSPRPKQDAAVARAPDPAAKAPIEPKQVRGPNLTRAEDIAPPPAPASIEAASGASPQAAANAAPETLTPETQAEPPGRKGGLFTSWFRSRVRGDVPH
jgi:peptidyl-tRNA hydrolase, PTH1 family